MRNKLLSAIAVLVVAMGIISCNDDDIGTSISDIQSALIEDSTFMIHGKTVRNNHLRSRSSIQLLGNVSAPGFGTLKSDVVAQFMPTTKIDTVGLHGGAQWIDSCFLTMRVAIGDFTGDSLAPMRMDVYKLNKQLPNPIYTDFNPGGYYLADDLMGSVSYSASETMKKTVESQNGTNTFYEINVPIPVEYARDLFNAYKLDPSLFSSPTEFAQLFPGVYITNSYGQGNVMNFYDIEFVTYYRTYEKFDETTDTIYPKKSQSYMAVTPEVLYNNNISLEPAPSIQSMIDDGEAIVMGPAGLEVELEFPIQEVIDKFKNDTKDALGIINRLTLEIPAEKIANKYDIAPPEYLLMVKKSYVDEFFDRDSLTNNRDAFYAEYDEDEHCYKFLGLRDYLLDIVNKKDGIATQDDIEFVIMPIDVTKYTNTNSSYYYYSSTSTTEVVTKIAPAIANPCLARLRLDKSKVKLSYSKQTMY